LEDKMKKVIILLALLALSLCAFSCGGGAGSADSPTGENPGVPSVVQLLPSHFIAQTNSSITLHAKVLDGNGVAVPNTGVTFTNLRAPFGVLSSTSANTDNQGLATVTISSTSPGFATIVAQVNNGVGNLRDKKSVFFTINDVMTASMSLDVDSVPGNGVDSLIFPLVGYDETGDFLLFESPSDDTVAILATVFDAGGFHVGGGRTVTWGADLPEAHFITGVDTDLVSVTNRDGQAKVVVQVTPESIRNTNTYLNIFAFADNGAANMVTLFLNPVTVSKARSSITADPSVVEPGGTSTITAIIILNTGTPAPNGTTVNFTTTCGTVDPFAQTAGGIATATFTAPPTPGTCTVTGRVAGVTISVPITVATALNVLPSTQTITNPVVTDHAEYTISGGVAPYSAISSHPSVVSVVVTGTTLTATVDVVPAADTTVTITVSDNAGATKTVTLVLDIPTPSPISVNPPSATICEDSIACSAATDTAVFTISGGTPPYTVTSSIPLVIPSPGLLAGSFFIVNATNNSILADTPVTLIIEDAAVPVPAVAIVVVTVIDQL